MQNQSSEKLLQTNRNMEATDMMLNDVVGLVHIHLDIHYASLQIESVNSFQGLFGFHQYLPTLNQNKTFDIQSKNTLSVFIHDMWFCSLFAWTLSLNVLHMLIFQSIVCTGMKKWYPNPENIYCIPSCEVSIQVSRRTFRFSSRSSFSFLAELREYQYRWSKKNTQRLNMLLWCTASHDRGVEWPILMLAETALASLFWS